MSTDRVMEQLNQNRTQFRVKQDVRAINPEFYTKCEQYLQPYYDCPEGDDRIAILVIAFQDFANVMSSIADAVNRFSTVFQMRVFCAIPHPFSYFPPHHFDYDIYIDKHALRPYLDKVKIVIWAEEANPYTYYSYYNCDNMFKNAMTLNTNILNRDDITKIIWHAGCPGRNNQEHYRTYDRHQFKAGFYSPDLIHVAHPLWYRSPLAQTILGKPLDEQSFPIRDKWNEDILFITHSPTNFYLKGTNIIRQAIELAKTMTKNGFVYEELGGPHHEGLSISTDELAARRIKYHVYIDQISSIGGIGMSSFEAMLSGLVTICSVHRIESLLDEVKCPIIRCNHTQPNKSLIAYQLAGILVGLINSYAEDRTEFVKLAHQSQRWTSEYTQPQRFANQFSTQLKAMLN